MKRPLLLVCLSLLSVAACHGSTPDSASDTPPDTAPDTGCTPETEPLQGEALLMCAAGVEVDYDCQPTEEYTLWTTLTCTDYAYGGYQVRAQLALDCAEGRDVACCDCRVELTPECNPCTVND